MSWSELLRRLPRLRGLHGWPYVSERLLSIPPGGSSMCCSQDSDCPGNSWGSYCSGGACVLVTSGGGPGCVMNQDCDGICDSTADVCQDGHCSVSGNCTAGPDQPSSQCCGTTWVSAMTDPQNCGACWHVCPADAPVCMYGQCVVAGDGGQPGGAPLSCSPTTGDKGNGRGVWAPCSPSNVGCPDGAICSITLLPTIGSYQLCVRIGCDPVPIRRSVWLGGLLRPPEWRQRLHPNGVHGRPVCPNP